MSDVVGEFINSEDCEHPSACFTETHICTKCRIIARQALDAERVEHQQSLELLDAELKRQSEALHFGTSQFVLNKRADELVRQVADLQQRISDLKAKSCPYHAPCEERDE
jgi:hypothetical protein